MRYRCDVCGEVIYIDPGEERICDSCQMEREQHDRNVEYCKKNFVEQRDGQMKLAI